MEVGISQGVVLYSSVQKIGEQVVNHNFHSIHETDLIYNDNVTIKI